MEKAAGRGHRERGKFLQGLTAALLEFGRERFALSKVDKATGKTRLQTIHEIAKQTGVLAPELEHPVHLPLEAEHLWRWYADLDAGRSAGFDLNPISWSDMRAYFALHRLRPKPWELQALRALDDAYLGSRTNAPTQKATGAGALRRRITGRQHEDAP